MEVTMEQPAVATGLPATWLGWRSEGGRASFVESGYGRETTEAACRARFPTATVEAHPMTLREIFISLARSGRTQP
jgi:ABC-2 type transport system ATP-binding protein